MKTSGLTTCVVLASLALLLVGCYAGPSIYFPETAWGHYDSPEEAGFDPDILEEVRAESQELDTAAMMIVHRGRVVDYWGDIETKYRCHSIRKSLLAGLYGIPVHQGAIDLDATMEELGIDDVDELSEQEKRATVRMLLQARSGIYHPALFETAGMAAARPERHSHEPGTNYYYNNWDFNALGTIYEQETGEKIHQSFEERIAKRIGMQDYTADDGRYVTGDESRHAAYPFEMSTRDLARFGHLYLNDGTWNGQQVLPAGWVEESTTAYSDIHSDPESDRMERRGGYGYMWWVAVDGSHFDGVDAVPEGTYTARGRGGHVLAVVPEHDLVVVHRVNTFESGNSVPYSEVGRLLMKIVEAK